MTDNEIIKALECCRKPVSDCVCCPVEYGEMCFDHLKTLALDLINRQKAEIDRLRDTIEKTDAAYFAKVGEVDRLKADIDEAPMLIDQQSKTSKQDYEYQMKILYEIKNGISLAIANAKTEAIKIYFNKLIDISVCKDNGDGTERLFVSIAAARKLVKEMVGKE